MTVSPATTKFLKKEIKKKIYIFMLPREKKKKKEDRTQFNYLLDQDQSDQSITEIPSLVKKVKSQTEFTSQRITWWGHHAVWSSPA